MVTNEVVDVCWKAGQDVIGIVLVKVQVGGLKAYIGAGLGHDEGIDTIHIAEYGTSLSYEEAKGFFPYLEKADYKR